MARAQKVQIRVIDFTCINRLAKMGDNGSTCPTRVRSPCSISVTVGPIGTRNTVSCMRIERAIEWCAVQGWHAPRAPVRALMLEKLTFWTDFGLNAIFG